MSTYKPKYNPPKDDDPYNAKDYFDLDSFYEDNYDDFFDWEDAEDYYRDHNSDGIYY